MLVEHWSSIGQQENHGLIHKEEFKFNFDDLIYLRKIIEMNSNHKLNSGQAHLTWTYAWAQSTTWLPIWPYNVLDLLFFFHLRVKLSVLQMFVFLQIEEFFIKFLLLECWWFSFNVNLKKQICLNNLILIIFKKKMVLILGTSYILIIHSKFYKFAKNPSLLNFN